jgi:hypothetical protein
MIMRTVPMVESCLIPAAFDRLAPAGDAGGPVLVSAEQIADLRVFLSQVSPATQGFCRRLRN